MELSKKAIASLTLLIIGLLLISKPIMGIFNKLQFIGGVPSLYAYLFLIWITIIGASSFLFRSRNTTDD